MIKFTDILVMLLESLTFFILGVFILEATEYPFLVLPLIPIFIIIHIAIKRQKHITEYVAKDFEKLGYTIISERPIPISDMERSISPTVTVGKVPIGRYAYIRRFNRLFRAKNENGQLVELKTSITKEWSGGNSIEIKEESVIE